MNYLLDTNVVSELISRRPHPNVVAWIDDQDAETLFISVITIGELRKGVERLMPSKRKDELRNWLYHDLLVSYEGRIVPLEVETLLLWGELVATLEAGGRTLPAMDSLIAATALHGDFTLVTRNEADFAHTGVKLFNPWP